MVKKIEEKEKEYLNTIRSILNNKQLGDSEKVAYIRMAEIVDNFTTDELIDYEDRSYTHKGKVLTDKERVSYELTQIYKKMIKTPDLDESFVDDLVKRLLYIIERNGKHDDNYQDSKDRITELQVALDMKPKFYTAFPNVLDSVVKIDYYNDSNKLDRYMKYYKELNKISKRGK